MVEDNHGDVQEELAQVSISHVVFRVAEQQNQASSTITVTITRERGSLFSVDFYTAMVCI